MDSNKKIMWKSVWISGWNCLKTGGFQQKVEVIENMWLITVGENVDKWKSYTHKRVSFPRVLHTKLWRKYNQVRGIFFRFSTVPMMTTTVFNN